MAGLSATGDGRGIDSGLIKKGYLKTGTLE